ncbi:ATP-binding cassette domain-containing protein [Salirhabdus sp. Marseille-P4669]|uniref:ATP-binding cassette domain-containing protein n=1 Tax=Salirhabdus sp. Marseille-P4669 TaxID=2042310 RepID=UPI000C7D49A5|nr:ATP-binding cassette domain-containing protein [Salirhabdus sp. Marseille-P4669]
MVSDLAYTHIKISQLQKSFGDLTVLKGIDLEVKKGEFIAIVGKSGCGKSTLLRLIAGLDYYDEGTLYVNGKKLTSLNKDARIMFQDGRLLPWKKVIDNVGIGLSGKWKSVALESLKQVGLEEKKDEWPSRLSGGQQQRVALARALVHKPELLLLDEPLGALDALTRIEMQHLIEEIWSEKKITSILVTHDVEEAVTLADRVILIRDGKIELNQEIDLPRPRQRTQSAFSNYVETILDKILKSPKEKSLRLVE